MKIQKIINIKKYKSFQNFSWHTFFNTENFHEKMNLLYGENGSGKTSICNILKNLSQNKEFGKYKPEEAEVLINGNKHKYSTQAWDNNISDDVILFFDREFVKKNVHVEHDRGTQHGEQEQESGKLIIEFDEDAINLRSFMKKLEEEKNNKNKQLEDYRRTNSSFLNFILSAEEERIFRKHKNKNNIQLKNVIKSLEAEKSDVEAKINSDQKLLENTQDIIRIEEIDLPNIQLHFSSKEKYQQLFDYELTEKSQNITDQELAAKIKEHKDFFELGFKIRNKHSEQCPFCQTRNEEQKIKDILDIYNKIYDASYKLERGKFLNLKETLSGEIDKLIDQAHNFNIHDIFIKLKKIYDKYAIKDIYSVNEEEELGNMPRLNKLSYLRKKVNELKKPTKEDISNIYDEAYIELNNFSTKLDNLSTLVKAKNKLIRVFKKDHTDTKLNKRIEKNKSILQNVLAELEFLKTDKIDKQKTALRKSKEEAKFNDVLEKAKTNYKEARNKYEAYCSSGAFRKILSKIESYFNNFNFKFKLQLDDTRHAGLTKELPFAFKVIDTHGIERDLKEGLSEGEIQVLSLCFFFAFLDIQKDKSKKILIFDDPITSLDDSNLSSLVDVIADISNRFSQIFILTHHRTFFKFLRKKFRSKTGSKKVVAKEYNVLRNKSSLGGSFICKSKEERFVEKLKRFESHTQEISQNQAAFDIELKIVEYGQYLRYEIEYLIKHKLLHWNKAADFTNVINGIKNNKKVLDEDLDKIREIYSFCNWTTSHVDIGDDHGLAQLKEKINNFVSIYDKVADL